MAAVGSQTDDAFLYAVKLHFDWSYVRFGLSIVFSVIFLSAFLGLRGLFPAFFGFLHKFVILFGEAVSVVCVLIQEACEYVVLGAPGSV